MSNDRLSNAVVDNILDTMLRYDHANGKSFPTMSEKQIIGLFKKRIAVCGLTKTQKGIISQHFEQWIKNGHHYFYPFLNAEVTTTNMSIRVTFRFADSKEDAVVVNYLLNQKFYICGANSAEEVDERVQIAIYSAGKVIEHETGEVPAYEMESSGGETYYMYNPKWGMLVTNLVHLTEGFGRYAAALTTKQANLIECEYSVDERAVINRYIFDSFRMVLWINPKFCLMEGLNKMVKETSDEYSSFRPSFRATAAHSGNKP